MKKLLTLSVFLIFLSFTTTAQTQAVAKDARTTEGDGIALAPARFELEMMPGTETTVVVNLDYHSATGGAQPARIVASLNDWSITKEGRVEYYRADSRPNSASSWLIYSPGEATVTPGKMHSIRVTVSVPLDAAPGDHLTALIIEQRPDTIKFSQNSKQITVRYRMASVFYIKVAGLTKHGSLENLLAKNAENGIKITPTLKNDGNSVIRPTASVKVADSSGKIVAAITDIEPLPLLRGSETSQSFLLATMLPPGTYTVDYRVDFQDGGKVTEGLTQLVVPEATAAAKPAVKASAAAPGFKP